MERPCRSTTFFERIGPTGCCRELLAASRAALGPEGMGVRGTLILQRADGNVESLCPKNHWVHVCCERFAGNVSACIVEVQPERAAESSPGPGSPARASRDGVEGVSPGKAKGTNHFLSAEGQHAAKRSVSEKWWGLNGREPRLCLRFVQIRFFGQNL